MRGPRCVPVTRGAVPVPLEALPSLLGRSDLGGHICHVPSAAAIASVIVRNFGVLCLSVAAHVLHLHRSRPWRRRETRQARQHPISTPNRPSPGATTKSPRPSATGPRRLTGSIRRPRRSKPRRTSAARARRGNPVVFDQFDVPARRQRRGLLPALPVRFQLHVRHGAPRVRGRGCLPA